MLTNEKLKELRKLAKNAPPGPYKDDVGDLVNVNDNLLAETTSASIGDYFAATDPQTVLELLDEIEQFRAQVAVMRKALEFYAYYEKGEIARQALAELEKGE